MKSVFKFLFILSAIALARCVDKTEVMSVVQHEDKDFQIVTAQPRPDIAVGDLLRVTKKHCVKSLLSTKKFLPNQQSCHSQVIGEMHVLNKADATHFGIEAHAEFLSLRDAKLVIEKIKK